MALDNIAELELEFEKEIKALQGIVFDNPSAVFFDVVLIKYFEVSLIPGNYTTKRFTIATWNGKKDLRNLMRMFYKYNLFYKNIVKKENIYFAVTYQTRFLNFVWLDDIKLENINEKQLPYLTLIETSPGNFQAWIKLDKVYPAEDVQQIKRYLIEKLGADKAAAARVQPMRLPGVYSYKHETPFFVRVSRVAEKTLNGKKLLEKIQPAKKVKFERENPTRRSGGSGGGWKKYSYYKSELGYENTLFNPEDERDAIIKYIQDNKKLAVDDNRVDIAYLYQLLIRDYSENDMFLYLQQSREDLEEKHVVRDYFERTYLKALLFKKLYFPEKKLYEHSLLLDYINEQQILGNWDNSKKVTENLKILVKQLEKKEQQEN